jgi:hypothetical protein
MYRILTPFLHGRFTEVCYVDVTLKALVGLPAVCVAVLDCLPILMSSK